ncbi:MAG: 30S ribosomal protein S13 [Candidatus Nanoarchaeia archaeon]
MHEKVEKREIRPLLRILDKDIDGEESIYLALTRVRGIDFMMSNAICAALGLPKFEKIGYLTDEQIAQIEDCMQNPAKYKIPFWLFNRRKDLETGENLHLVSSTLKLRQDLDIKFLKKIKNYRGYCHSIGRRVRGQKTRTTGRTGGTLGVVKKKEAPKAKPAEKKSAEKK